MQLDLFAVQESVIEKPKKRVAQTATKKDGGQMDLFGVEKSVDIRHWCWCRLRDINGLPIMHVSLGVEYDEDAEGDHDRAVTAVTEICASLMDKGIISEAQISSTEKRQANHLHKEGSPYKHWPGSPLTKTDLEEIISDH